MRANSAFTLIEALVVLAIVAVLYGVAYPSLQSWFESQQAKNKVSQLYLMLQSARQKAILTGNSIALCPSVDRRNCSSDWAQPLILFNDRDRSQSISEEKIYLVLPPLKSTKEKLTFNGQAIVFNSQGMAGLNNGSLTYCIQGRNDLKVNLVISRVGRIRYEKMPNQPCN